MGNRRLAEQRLREVKGRGERVQSVKSDEKAAIPKKERTEMRANSASDEREEIREEI